MYAFHIQPRSGWLSIASKPCTLHPNPSTPQPQTLNTHRATVDHFHRKTVVFTPPPQTVLPPFPHPALEQRESPPKAAEASPVYGAPLSRGTFGTARKRSQVRCS